MLHGRDPDFVRLRDSSSAFRQEAHGMKLPRRHVLRIAASAAALWTFPHRAFALDYPVRPVRIIVGFPAGNASDIIARLVAQSLSDRLGQQFIVENRPGAAGNMGSEFVARAQADGYTLLMEVVSSNTINATLYPSPTYNFVRDIAPVASIGSGPYVMVVNPAVPAGTLGEFIALAKANPGKINMASAGSGTGTHIIGEMFKMTAGVDLLHVPYRGSFVADLLGGQVQVVFGPMAQLVEYARGGKLRALAVTSATRQVLLPDVPAVAEVLPGFEASLWYGVGAPKSTPGEIVDRLNKEINAVLADPKMQARLADLGDTVLTGSPADFGKLIAADIDKWAKVIKFANIKPE
jgi:tripartite-type tricarboxylate transporter receptor subunit TctC